MNLHEFQAKEILAGYGLPSPGGKVAITPDQAGALFGELGAPTVAVKAQVHAGARGKAGGIQLVHSAEEAKAAAAKMLGKKLVTGQTGVRGRVVKRVYLEVGIERVRDLHIALLIDGTTGQVMLLGSAQGGEDIEERAELGQLKLERLGLGDGRTRRADEVAAFAHRIRIDSGSIPAFEAIIDGLRRAFVELDASLIEINPLAILRDGSFQALDVKMVLDDNALFRHPDLAALRDEDEVDQREVEAQRHRLNYVSMDGNIGLVANGAGLGLATVDLVCAAKGRPGNFMDIRTTANSLDVAYGFGLLLDNPALKAIFLNVHGGGMQPCDTIAEGLGIAMRRTGRSLPVVARLAGNNAEFARARFINFGCPVIECPDMWSAATRVVALAQKGA
ncbi:MAG: ADP-forming succinate--CoA ligase subunit beta [Afipia sp.]|nr:ADP-forming succinate--CoA ligase subunit beta [Afipia sp.]OJW66186.1 MAG: succinyl-CoA synthetase subunit beta [Afipia sp. 64-13]